MPFNMYCWVQDFFPTKRILKVIVMKLGYGSTASD